MCERNSQVDAPRILIVEDQTVTARHLQSTLEGFGYETGKAARTGEEAVKRAEELSPDLVLMDIMLAGDMDGVQAADRIRSRLDVPIIFLTAYGDRTVMDRAKAAEPFGYLLKPFRPEELRSTIEMALYKHKMELLLRESRRKYRDLVELLPQFVYEMDSRGYFTFANSNGLELAGYNRKDIEAGLNILEVCTPEEIERATQDMRKVLQGESVREREYTLVKKDGSRMPVMTYATPIVEHGTVVGIRGVGVDITDLKRSEAALRQHQDELEQRVEERTAELVRANEKLKSEILERTRAELNLHDSESRFRHFLENLPDAVYETDETGNLSYVNKIAGILVGRPRSELIGRPLSALIDEDDQDTAKQVFEAALKGEDPGSELKLRSGPILHFKSQPRTDAGGKTPGVLGVARDVTQERVLKKQLLQAQKMEAVGTLAGGIAHDFNNLLQVIEGYADIAILNTGEGQAGHKEATEIRHAAQIAAELTQSLLTFSRTGESRPRIVNLNSVLEHMAKLLSRTIPKTISVSLSLAPQVNAMLADAGQVRQLVLNLALNARDAMPDGGRLVIETGNVYLDQDYCTSHPGAEAGDYVMLSVSDTGHGMSAETLEHIYEPFFTTKDTGKGTGLGLSMVHGIVRQHGGIIACASTRTVGTVFKIFLPAVEPAGAFNDVEEPPELVGGAETLLVVDDEESVRNVLEETLTRFGYSVLTASNGREGIELYNRERARISLIILDLVMPEMGGQDCLKEILAIDPAAKVIIASGYTTDDQMGEALQKGAIASIRKPYGVGQILEIVRRVLEGR
jgi:PAS domain S-box-containing protein